MLRIIFLGVFAICSVSLTAQVKDAPKIDSVENQIIDNTELQKDVSELQKKSQKRGFSKFMSRLFIRNKAHKHQEIEEKSQKDLQKKASAYKQYDGKIIRNIDIVSLKPYQESQEYDSIFFKKNKKHGKFAKFADSFHAKTANGVLRNHIMFKKNQELSSVVLDENLAFLRNLSYIYDVQFLVDSVACDSVDILLVSRDVMAYSVNVNRIDDRKSNFEFSNKNIFGTGTSFNANFIYYTYKNPHIGFRLRHRTYNAFGLFFNSDLNFYDTYNTHQRTATIERTLVPNISNIVGAKYFYNDSPQYLLTSDTTMNIINESASAWIGKAFYINKRTHTRFVAQFGYSWQHLRTRNLPNNNLQIYYPYERNEMYILQLSLYKQTFHTNRFIYSYGAHESTPIGYNATVQFGYENHMYFNRFYTSAQFAYGHQFKNGYHYHTIQLGTFIRNGHTEQGLIKINGNYFSNLYNLGKARVRHFLNASYSVGINRLHGEGDYLFLTDETTLNVQRYRTGFYGKQRVSWTWQTSLFTNADIWGSRLVFFGFVDAGFIGNKTAPFSNPFYYGFGAGVRLGNEFLVFRAIELRLGYYPKLPQEGLSRYFDCSRVDKFVSNDFRPQVPAVIPFQ